MGYAPYRWSQVTKAIAEIMPHHHPFGPDPRKLELEKLEMQKAAIDVAAESKVRAELCAGLCALLAQTIAFMRLTFWELSWDVMEPICFFVTSGYCGAAFLFYLLTRKEPSFENLFHVRFLKKQKRLMKASNFDMARYEELKTAAASFDTHHSSLSTPASNKNSCVPLL